MTDDAPPKVTKRFKIRYVVYAAVLLILAVVCLIPGGRKHFREAVWSCLPAPNPHQLSVPGDPALRGTAGGQKFKWEIKLLDKIYIRAFAAPQDFPKYLQQAHAMFERIPKRWSDEVEAMAKASGVESDVLKLGNTFLDLGLNASGCRQIHAAGRDGFYHSHNLDWDNLGGVGNYLVTIIRSDSEPGRLKTVHITFPGLVGSLDIINEKGVALSFNQLGVHRGKESLYPVFIAIRDIAETCPDFATARERIKAMPYGMPFCIGLSSAKERQTAIFERSNSGTEVFERPGENHIATADNMSWGDKRTGEIDKIVRETTINTPQDIMTLLRNPRIMLDCNIYSVIFDFDHNVFYLASGRVPAAAGTYRQFPLF